MQTGIELFSQIIIYYYLTLSCSVKVFTFKKRHRTIFSKIGDTHPVLYTPPQKMPKFAKNENPAKLCG